MDSVLQMSAHTHLFSYRSGCNSHVSIYGNLYGCNFALSSKKYQWLYNISCPTFLYKIIRTVRREAMTDNSADPCLLKRSSGAGQVFWGGSLALWLCIRSESRRRKITMLIEAFSGRAAYWYKQRLCTNWNSPHHFILAPATRSLVVLQRPAP